MLFTYTILTLPCSPRTYSHKHLPSPFPIPPHHPATSPQPPVSLSPPPTAQISEPDCVGTRDLPSVRACRSANPPNCSSLVRNVAFWTLTTPTTVDDSLNSSAKQLVRRRPLGNANVPNKRAKQTCETNVRHATVMVVSSS
jgi:hypothetical protein